MMLKVWPAMFPNHISELEARTKYLPEWDWCPSLHGKQFLSDKKDDLKKWSSTKEALVLSGVPVRQVQEDSVRDRGFKHRKLAQMACHRIPNVAPLLWQDVGIVKGTGT